MPVGDKAQQQIQLPEKITRGSNEVKIAYLQELIPEDGNFHHGRFSWSRSIVLVSPTNLEFGSKLKEKHLKFIEGFGEKRTSDYGFEDYDRNSIVLKRSALQQLSSYENPKISKTAKEIIECIEGNPSKLIIDEVNLARSLGMKIDVHPNQLTIFTDTGRTSAKWTAATTGYASGIRWALMAPPDHERKRKAVADWLVTSFVKPQ